MAQDYPGTTPTTAAPACTLSITASAPMLPNATVSVTLSCDAIVGGQTYTGRLLSTPVALPATVAAQNDAVTFNNVKLPADWEVNASHKAELVSQSSGATIGSVSFFVSSKGTITSPPGTNLPKTGSNSIAPALRTASVLLAVGGAVLLTARRRRAEALAS
jgi:LPXTG-motif cell wall-anchored protein